MQVEELVEKYGWEELGQKIKIKSFQSTYISYSIIV